MGLNVFVPERDGYGGDETKFVPYRDGNIGGTQRRVVPDAIEPVAYSHQTEHLTENIGGTQRRVVPDAIEPMAFSHYGGQSVRWI